MIGRMTVSSENTTATMKKEGKGENIGGKPPYVGRPNPVNVAYEKRMSELDVRISTAKERLVRVRGWIID